jgi:hypothetical protein
MAGHRGDTRDFLVLLEQPARQGKGKTEDPIFEIVDHWLPEVPLGEFANSPVARLRAKLEFRGPETGKAGAGNATDVTDTSLATLVGDLDQETRQGEFNGSFFRVEANTELYAPVLELAEGEPDYLSDVDIWQEIRPLAEGTSRKSYEIAYASMGDRRWSRCTSYVRTLSYPGT